MYWWHWWCCWYHVTLLSAIVSHDQKSNFALHFDLTHGMVPLMMLGIMWHWHQNQWHCMTKKSKITHCFKCLDLMNAVELLTMPLVWHDVDASANSDQWLKKSCCISFWSSWTNKCNDGIDDAISVMSCHTNTCLAWQKCHVAPYSNHLDLRNKILSLTMPSVSCKAPMASHDQKNPTTPFLIISPNEENDSTDDTVSITWQHCWYQWHHMTDSNFTSF